MTEAHPLTQNLFVWGRYDPSIKAEMFSSALKTKAGVVLVDPIALDSDSLEEFIGEQKPAAVIATNTNHARESSSFAARFSTPIFAHPAAEIPAALLIPSKALFESGLTIIPIEGAAAGEIALHCDDDNGTMIIGDALTNFGSDGFSFLPSRYCSNQKLMRKSLRKLLDLSFERILFAHGSPIISRGRTRLSALLEESK